MDNFFTIDGKSCLDFGIIATGSGTYNKPKRRVEYIDVPGRNGSLSVSDGTYENVRIWYDCYAFKKFPDKINALAAWLLSTDGYVRLEDTYHPEYYRMAIFEGPIEPTPTTLMRSGTFRLEFNCKPERWLKSGEHFREMRESTIFNPTPFPAKPVIRAHGNGGRSVSINGIRLDFGRNQDTGTPLAYNRVDFDCEQEEAFGIATDGTEIDDITMSRFLVLHENKYPILEPGENAVETYTIEADGTLTPNRTDFEIRFRWWSI